jgi:hypothetical protein
MEGNADPQPLAASTSLEQPVREAAVWTSDVNVIFTTIEATMSALRVAAILARACNASVRLIAPQPAPPTYGDASSPRSPVESDAFRARLAREIDARVQVLVCVVRSAADIARTLLRRHSLVVIGGRRSWLPTRQERLRRALEAQGHFVVFVSGIEEAAGSATVRSGV